MKVAALLLALFAAAGEARPVAIFKKEIVETLPFIASNKTHVVKAGADGFCDM